MIVFKFPARFARWNFCIKRRIGGEENADSIAALAEGISGDFSRRRLGRTVFILMRQAECNAVGNEGRGSAAGLCPCIGF